MLSQPRPGPWPGGPRGESEATSQGLFPRTDAHRRLQPRPGLARHSAGGRMGLARGASFGRGSVRSAAGSSCSPRAGEGGPARPRGAVGLRAFPAPPARRPAIGRGGKPYWVPWIAAEPEAPKAGKRRPFVHPDPLALQPSLGNSQVLESASLRAARPRTDPFEP